MIDNCPQSSTSRLPNTEPEKSLKDVLD